MFKETKIAAVLALIVPGISLAEISYDPIGANADKSKEILEFRWDSTRTGGNVSETGQLGYNNSSYTEQDAGGVATSTVLQLGKGNDAIVDQDKTASTSTVYQNGLGNKADVKLRKAAESTSIVEQTGEHHKANVRIRGEYNDSIVTQDGYGQFADVVIDGATNYLDSVQVGSDNKATITIWGDLNNVDNDQGGWGNKITTYAAGESNTVKTSQWGEGNKGTVTIYGNGNKTLLQQSGKFQIANLYTDGTNNTLKSDQFKSQGSRIDANVEGKNNSLQATQQFGSKDKITVDLVASNGNDIYLLQEYSGDNLIDIDFDNTRRSFVAAYQTGWRNTAKIDSTYGSHDSFVVKQAGDDNYAASVVK